MNTRRLFAATWGHLSIDIVNGSVAMILVAVAGRFELGISQIGFGALVYQISAAMSQPLFGGLTDRLRGRWVGGIAVLWTLAFYTAAAFMPTYETFLGLLMIGGLGSGAFHAAGLLNASVSGGSRPATATSIFFVGGQVGLALGPIIAGVVLARVGLHGMAWVAAAMAPAAVLMLLWMNDPLPETNRTPAPTDSQASGATAGQAAGWILIVAFILLITFRSGTAQSFSTLLPKYYEDQGIPSSTYGFWLGLFAFAGALGTFVGGFLGDRVDRRLLIFGVTVAAAPLSWIMLHSTGWVFTVTAFSAGLLLSIPHSIILVLAQELAPGRRGLVGGLVLGFIFASGSTVTWLASLGADRFGLVTVLSWLAWIPIGAGLVALLLPPERRLKPAPLSPVPTTPAEPSPAGTD